jgi:hypothetical protein
VELGPFEKSHFYHRTPIKVIDALASEGELFAPYIFEAASATIRNDAFKLIFIYSKIPLHFRKVCGIFCEGESLHFREDCGIFCD